MSATVGGFLPYGRPSHRLTLRAFGGRLHQVREILLPGCFGLDAGPVALLLRHDPGHRLASTAAGTLQLQDGPDGLRFEAVVDARDPAAAALVRALRFGRPPDGTGLSPAFRVLRLGPWQSRGGVPAITIARAALVEISITDRPAFPGTELRLLRDDPRLPGAPPARHLVGVAP